LSEKFVREWPRHRRGLRAFRPAPVFSFLETGEFAIPHFPKPFFRKPRGLWYVQISGKQVNLGPDQDAAFRRYHELLANRVMYTFSQTSRRNYFRSIKRCLKWAVVQGYIDVNPIQHLELPAGERRDVYVAPDEFQRLPLCSSVTSTAVRNQ
jgi:hypothetical protein